MYGNQQLHITRTLLSKYNKDSHNQMLLPYITEAKANRGLTIGSRGLFLLSLRLNYFSAPEKL